LKIYKAFFVTLFFLIFSTNISPAVHAQTSTDKPIYIVQSGDTLNVIAARFGVDPQDLIDANQITNPNALVVGTQLVIPGVQGISGVLTTETLPLAATLRNISLQNRISSEALVKINRITSPVEFYAGANVILTQQDENNRLYPQTQLASGESLLEYAASHLANLWEIASLNNESSQWNILPAETIFTNNKPVEGASTTSYPSPIQSIEISPLPLAQGATAVIKVTTSSPIQLSGTLIDRELHFYSTKPGEYVALQGIHAMASTGITPFSLSGTPDSGESFKLSQMLLLQSGNFAEDPKLYVDPTTIDPKVTQPEEDQVKSIVGVVTPEQYWSGIFRPPVDEPICIKSWYGNRRSYNDSDFIYFHTGVDYGVCANLNIYAPAPGVVVFAGLLNVRGNTVIIDHGEGVFSGLYHQQEIKVKVGDKVEAGQLIGLIGGTGRVTGPHLHFDVFVNGVQVQPLDWLEKQYP
jgi:murein DD-endopeptidase MepM/ murein hydrolase activator NlpD